MNKRNILQLKAIKAAKDEKWDEAIDLNQQILELDAKDLGALNRIGVAYLQSGHPTKAKKTFNQVLEQDSSNILAKKHLKAIKQKKKSTKPLFSREHFIEEPGRSKIVELHRLASKSVLEKLSVSEKCSFKLKGRYISVETESGDHIGALPEDLSFRLAKLIKQGNTYECFVYSTTSKSCRVFVKELKRSPKLADVNSFPLNKSSRSAISQISEVDDRFLLEDNIPVEIIKTDEDTEDRSLKEIQKEAVEQD